MFQDVVYGAYGNANTDTIAYLDVGIRPNIVYLVNYFINDCCKQFLKWLINSPIPTHQFLTFYDKKLNNNEHSSNH